MTPSFVRYDKPYIPTTNSKGISKGEIAFALGRALANCAYFVLCKFGLCMTTSFHVSPFLNHVLDVVKVGSQKQMFRVDARRIIALMEAMQVIKNGAEVNFPRKSVGVQRFVKTIQSKNSITFYIQSTCPQPTAIWSTFINKIPESLNCRTIGLMATDEANWLMCYPSSPDVGLFSQCSSFTTAAHAQSAGIWAYKYIVKTALVAPYIAFWLSFDQSCPSIVSIGKIGLLSAATVTIAVRDFLRGIIEVHGKLSFLCQARGDSQSLPGVSIGRTLFYHSLLSEINTLVAEGKYG